MQSAEGAGLVKYNISASPLPAGGIPVWIQCRNGSGRLNGTSGTTSRNKRGNKRGVCVGAGQSNKRPAQYSGRAQLASFNFLNTQIRYFGSRARGKSGASRTDAQRRSQTNPPYQVTSLPDQLELLSAPAAVL